VSGSWSPARATGASVEKGIPAVVGAVRNASGWQGGTTGVASPSFHVDRSLLEPVAFRPHRRPAGLSGSRSHDPADRRASIDLGLQFPEGKETADQTEQHRGPLRDLLLGRHPDRRPQQPLGGGEAQQGRVTVLNRPSMPSAGPAPSKRRPLDRADHRGTHGVTFDGCDQGGGIRSAADVHTPRAGGQRKRAGPVPSASATDRLPGGKRSHPMTWSPRRSLYAPRRADCCVRVNTSPRRTVLSGCLFTASSCGGG
jgi:hypothetical protein